MPCKMTVFPLSIRSTVCTVINSSLCRNLLFFFLGLSFYCRRDYVLHTTQHLQFLRQLGHCNALSKVVALRTASSMCMYLSTCFAKKKGGKGNAGTCLPSDIDAIFHCTGSSVFCRPTYVHAQFCSAKQSNAIAHEMKFGRQHARKHVWIMDRCC